MTLCGLDHEVTANLEVALRHIRQKDQPRTLWVDALCINQSDLKERTDQIKLMNQIYTAATTVLSWVGEESDDSYEAMQLLQELGQFVNNNGYELFQYRKDSLPQLVEDLGFSLKHQKWPALEILGPRLLDSYLDNPGNGLKRRLRIQIYALLGLANQEYLTFPADYNKQTNEMIKDLVQFVINQEQNLYVLRGNRYRQAPVRPSWVPDILSQPEEHGDSALADAQELEYFMASLNKKPSVKFEGELMLVQGLLAGELQDVVGPSPRVFFSNFSSALGDPVNQAFASGVDEIFEPLRKIYDKLNDTKEDVMWRTLIMHRRRHERELLDPHDWGAMFRVLLRKDSPPASFKPGVSEDERRRQFTWEYLVQFRDHLSERCFFTTKCGRMGVGPYPTRPGDIAAVLYGCDHVLILRPVGAQFQLVGDAYVHGIMQGELLGGQSDQVFELC